MTIVLHLLLSLLPVFLFLAGLVFLDSFRLVRVRSIVVTIGIGGLSALAAYAVNSFLMSAELMSDEAYRRYGAPIVEEILKAVYLVFLLKKKRIGFMVDAALFGFALGAGFAFVENIYYLQTLSSASIVVWVIRGFGTAVMHGGTTAIVGTMAKNRSDVKGSDAAVVFLPGLAVAVVIHSIFNHFFFSPVLATLLILVAFPAILSVVFKSSERITREWLGVGFDTDVELLNMILDGNITRTRIGTYLESLESRFRGEVLADMLCYLRINLELSLKAKAILLMRECGIASPPDPELAGQLSELKFLERSIGPTGKMLLKPFVNKSSRDLWQLRLLESNSS